MRVFFKENYDCIINGNTTKKLGEMLCEVLNLDMLQLERLDREIASILNGINLLADNKKEMYEGTVINYMTILKLNLERIVPCKEEMKRLPFYMYTEDVDNAFNLLNQFIDGLLYQLKTRQPKDLILDVQLVYEHELYDEAAGKITRLIKTTSKCNVFFRAAVDACLLYNPNSTEDNSIRRLAQYGVGNFNTQVGDLVSYANDKIAVAQPLVYETVEDNDGLSLLQCLDFKTLPQYIYHEFMKMISFNMHVRHCKNCGKFFVIYGERVVEYCGNIPEGEQKPCSVIGPSRLYEKRLKDDPILEIYTRAYKKYVARRRSGSVSTDEFKAWTIKARGLRDKAQEENVSPEEFTVWMK